MQWLKDHLVWAEGFKFIGFAVIVGTSFFVPVPARIAILAGCVALGIGYGWSKLVK